jgi:hypothetical protein
MTTELLLPYPAETPWHLWAPYVAAELAAYNVPVPPVAEDAWYAWAVQVYRIPEIVSLGCPDPTRFPGWREWATTFLQTSA